MRGTHVAMSTSVVMPHKKNPYSLTWLRGAARHSLGTATGLSATLLTSSGQPDSRTFAYLDVPILLSQTTLAVQLLRAVVETMSFDEGAMRKAATTGFTTSTEICDHLSLGGAVDNRTSHQIVGAAVRHAVEAGHEQLRYDDLTLAASEAGVELDVDLPTFTRLIDADAALAERLTPGGAAFAEVEAMADEWRADAQRSAELFLAHPSHGYDDRLVERVRTQLQQTKDGSE